MTVIAAPAAHPAWVPDKSHKSIKPFNVCLRGAGEKGRGDLEFLIMEIISYDGIHQTPRTPILSQNSTIREVIGLNVFLLLSLIGSIRAINVESEAGI